MGTWIRPTCRTQKIPLANLYPNQYILVNEIFALPRQLTKTLREFPEDARQDAGYQIDKVQRGEQADDFKPMPSIGKGVEDIRI